MRCNHVRCKTEASRAIGSHVFCDAHAAERDQDQEKTTGEPIPMFPVGEVVGLKSGGPWMTVIYAAIKTPFGKMVGCAWFDGNKIEMSTFSAGALRRKGTQE